MDISLVSLVKNAGRQKVSRQSLCFDQDLIMMLSVIWIQAMLLTIPPFALLAISNGDILCFVKIPSFDGDIFSFAHSFPDMGRSHTTTEDFFSIEIFICTPGHSSAVFPLCGWWWSICTVYWIEIFICWEFYSPLSGVLGSLHGHGSQGVVRLFHTDCTISYHLLHHFVPFFCTRFKHCVPPHHTVHRDFTLKHCAHQCNVQEAVHGNGKYSHVGLFSSSMFNLEARR